MYMYNIIVYVCDLSNEQPVTIIEHRTRFFVPDCLCHLQVGKKINYDMYDQEAGYIPISTLPVTNVCHGFLEYLPGPYISRYLQPEGGGGISKLQYFNCHSERIHCCPTRKLLLHLYLPKKKSQTRYKTLHQHLMLIAQVQGRFFMKRKLK